MAEHRSDIQKTEKLAGLVLIAAAAAALIAANSGLSHAYHAILETEIGPPMPRFGVLDVHHWIADGLMAIFFLLVGLEVKREWYDGRLSTPAERRLPFVAAGAGMAVPALIYLVVTGFDPSLIRGWAIPSATDIAFAIGVLALLGSRANPTVKLLLVTIAIVDDVGAVMIIALVYTASLDGAAIGLSLVILAVMAALNLFGIRRLWPYMLCFALLWYAMLASGIHATIAGVLAAFTVPIGRGEDHSPLKRLEHGIHPWVMFGVMPLFGLASAGVEVTSVDALFQPLPLAIIAGLFLGKQIGVFGAVWLCDRTGLAPRPAHTRWAELYGASVLCGIGFTMSLFIAVLAFPTAPEEVEAAKLGILAGSLLSALLGFAVLRAVAPVEFSDEDREEAIEIFGEDQDERFRQAEIAESMAESMAAGEPAMRKTED
jgi:NhaA family Na+:H+ antiporter